MAYSYNQPGDDYIGDSYLGDVQIKMDRILQPKTSFPEPYNRMIGTRILFAVSADGTSKNVLPFLFTFKDALGYFRIGYLSDFLDGIVMTPVVTIAQLDTLTDRQMRHGLVSVRQVFDASMTLDLLYTDVSTPLKQIEKEDRTESMLPAADFYLNENTAIIKDGIPLGNYIALSEVQRDEW